MFTTRTLKLLNCVAVIGLVFSAYAQEEKAQKYLMRSLEGDYKTNVVAVIKQKSEDQGTVIVKIQRSRDGKTRQTVLSPLHMQCEYLDDGETVQTYSQDDRVLIVQPSSSVAQDLKFRIPLIQKNYTLKLEKSRKIAGRNCAVVTASSKFNQVPDIRYYFDEQTGFPLSRETIRSNGEAVPDYEVVDIKFPRDLDKSIFKIDPVIGVEVVRYSEPKCYSGVSEAAQSLGFTPIVPSKMPFGFQIQKMTVSSKNKVKMLCLKLSDGLQRVTVYEWVPVAGETVKTGEDREIRLHNGLKIVVVSDIESEIRESIIRTFLVRSDRENPAILTSVGI